MKLTEFIEFLTEIVKDKELLYIKKKMLSKVLHKFAMCLSAESEHKFRTQVLKLVDKLNVKPDRDYLIKFI